MIRFCSGLVARRGKLFSAKPVQAAAVAPVTAEGCADIFFPFRAGFLLQQTESNSGLFGCGRNYFEHVHRDIGFSLFKRKATKQNDSQVSKHLKNSCIWHLVYNLVLFFLQWKTFMV